LLTSLLDSWGLGENQLFAFIIISLDNKS
jgi:hypothetical protein